MEAVKGPDIGNQAGVLSLEDFPDCLIAHLGMFVCLGISNAAIFKPCIEFGIGLVLRARHKVPAADHADLVLNLTLLPARRRGAGNRFHQIVTAHLLEPPVIGPILANKDRIHRRLHVVINTARTNGIRLWLRRTCATFTVVVTPSIRTTSWLQSN